MKKLLPLLLALSAGLFHAGADADEAAIRKTLRERYPGLPVQSVTPSAMPGLYEIYAGGKLVYSSETGDYIVMGPLVETKTRANLSQKRLDELRAVKWESLPLDKAVRIVRGKGERQLAVFSDPDCPYCQRLEQELKLLDNVTVHLFLLPLADLHPGAPAIANNVWCAADRAQAWHDYIFDKKKPADATCDTPLKDIEGLAAHLGINGTPAIIFPNGKRADGALSAGQIESMLKAGK